MSDKQYAQAGRFMFIVAWILFFGLMFLFFHYYTDSERGSYQINHGTVTITPDKQGHYGMVPDTPERYGI